MFQVSYLCSTQCIPAQRFPLLAVRATHAGFADLLCPQASLVVVLLPGLDPARNSPSRVRRAPQLARARLNCDPGAVHANRDPLASQACRIRDKGPMSAHRARRKVGRGREEIRGGQGGRDGGGKRGELFGRCRARMRRRLGMIVGWLLLDSDPGLILVGFGYRLWLSASGLLIWR